MKTMFGKRTRARFLGYVSEPCKTKISTTYLKNGITSRGFEENQHFGILYVTLVEVLISMNKIN